jgi:hypothetical protein
MAYRKLHTSCSLAKWGKQPFRNVKLCACKTNQSSQNMMVPWPLHSPGWACWMLILNKESTLNLSTVVWCAFGPNAGTSISFWARTPLTVCFPKVDFTRVLIFIMLHLRFLCALSIASQWWELLSYSCTPNIMRAFISSLNSSCMHSLANFVSSLVLYTASSLQLESTQDVVQGTGHDALSPIWHNCYSQHTLHLVTHYPWQQSG